MFEMNAKEIQNQLKKMPFCSLKKEFDNLGIQEFKDVQIDSTSMEVLNKAFEIIQNQQHPLHPNSLGEDKFRFVILYFFDKETKTFHLRIALGLPPACKIKNIDVYKNEFIKTRVCQPPDYDSVGIVHNQLVNFLLKEGDTVSNYKNLRLGASFYLDSSGLIEPANRSGQNENLFQINKLASCIFSYPVRAVEFEPLANKNEPVILFKKIEDDELLDLVNNNKIVISQNKDNLTLYFSNDGVIIKEFSINNENPQLIEKIALIKDIISKKLPFKSSFNLYNAALKALISAEDYTMLGDEVDELLVKNGYTGNGLRKFADFYEFTFLSGARNMPLDLFFPLTKETINSINTSRIVNNQPTFFSDEKNFMEASYPYTTTHTSMWKSIQHDPNMISNFITRNLLINSSRKVREHNKVSQKNTFFSLLNALDNFDINIYSTPAKNNLSLLVFLAANASVNNDRDYYHSSHMQIELNNQGEIEIKISNLLPLNKDLTITLNKTDLENFSSSDLYNKLKNNEPIYKPDLSSEFYEYIAGKIEQNTLKKEHQCLLDVPVETHPIWFTSYLTAFKNDNSELLDILEKKLVDHYKNNNKEEIETLLTQAFDYAKTNKNNDLQKLLFSLMENIGINLSQDESRRSSASPEQ